MEGAPPRYNARIPDELLEHLAKPVFQAGISWRVVEAKWPSTKAAFHRFRAARVARMTDREIDALAKDERVIRSRPKIAAIVHNANELLALEKGGGFRKHLRSFPDYPALEKDLKKRFKFLGPSGIYHFLYSIKYPVPDWHEWAAERGIVPGQRTKRKRPGAKSGRVSRRSGV
jgi:3-methyladenine DNA glycosylase Tag